MMQLAVGQKLWFVPRYEHNARDVEVVKVGRKWAHVTGYFGRPIRIDVETLRPHEDDTSGQCYLSRQQCEEHLAREAAWKAFLRDIESKLSRWKCPAGVTVEKIHEARKLLGLEVVTAC